MIEGRRISAAARYAVEWLARGMLAAVFLYAGSAKAADVEGFEAALAAFVLLPEAIVPWVARVLPWLEIATGLALLIPRFSRAGAWAAAALLVSFMGLLGWAMSEGLVVGCGCFGREEEPPSPEIMGRALIRNGLLLAAAWWLAWRKPQRVGARR